MYLPSGEITPNETPSGRDVTCLSSPVGTSQANSCRTPDLLLIASPRVGFAMPSRVQGTLAARKRSFHGAVSSTEFCCFTMAGPSNHYKSHWLQIPCESVEDQINVGQTAQRSARASISCLLRIERQPQRTSESCCAVLQYDPNSIDGPVC